MKSLSNTTVLITGASRGIGAAIAERFAQEGMRIVIHYMQAHEAANEVARRCIDQGCEVMTVCADLRDREQLQRMKDKLAAAGFEPDILVNNAGVSYYGLFTDVTEEEWDACMSLNLKGVFFMTQLYVPHMIRQKYGRIINVSSVWGITGASCEVMYSVAKGGVNTFTKALAKELAPSGVTVNAVAPGAVDTQMLNHLEPDERTALEEEIPVGRLGTPQEIASLVYFLSLPESSYITGQVISPNGGWQV